jgi:transposase
MMELTQEQYQEIKPSLPVQKGQVKLSNRKLLNRILYVAEQGCQWRGLASKFGNWPPIYRRMNRGAKTGVLNGRFEAWPAKKVIPVRIEGYSLDSKSVKVHPDGTGALKKTASRRLESQEEGGPQKSIWLPKMLVQQ